MGRARVNERDKGPIAEEEFNGAHEADRLWIGVFDPP